MHHTEDGERLVEWMSPGRGSGVRQSMAAKDVGGTKAADGWLDGSPNNGVKDYFTPVARRGGKHTYQTYRPTICLFAFSDGHQGSSGSALGFKLWRRLKIARPAPPMGARDSIHLVSRPQIRGGGHLRSRVRSQYLDGFAAGPSDVGARQKALEGDLRYRRRCGGGTGLSA